MNQELRKQALNLLLNKKNSFNVKRFRLLSENHPVKMFFNSDIFKDCCCNNEKFYRIKNNIDCAPLCPVCGNSIKFELSTSSYHRFCSCRCTQLDKDVREKNKQTNMILYGVTNGALAQKSKEKYKETSLRRYGSTNYFSSDIGKKKIKESIIKKYGVDNCRKSNSIKLKSIETCREKYGVDYPQQKRDIRLKSQQKYTYYNQNFDSGLELYYYIYLTDNSITFEYSPNICFDYLDNNGKQHKYFPDFIVNDIITEIKGNHFFENGKMINPYDRSMDDLYESKHQCMINNHVRILTENDLKDVLDYVNLKYGKDFIKQFKNDKE